MALARLLADAGWDLTLLAREPTRLDSARTELVARGARVLAQSTDVADMPAVERAMQAAIFAHGVPRLVIAGAGMVVPRPFEVQSLDAFRRTMEVNYFGTLHLARAAVPAMRQAGGGRIVMVASATALLGLYGYTSYAPSKFAVRGLAEALRSELAPDGVAVSVVYPPDTDTPGYREEARTRSDGQQPAGGHGRAHDGGSGRGARSCAASSGSASSSRRGRRCGSWPACTASSARCCTGSGSIL